MKWRAIFFFVRRQSYLGALAGVFLCACERKPAESAAKPWEEFSGSTALDHVKRLVDLGPRPSGSEAIEKARAYISQQLESYGWAVTRQAFSDATPRGKVEFANLRARFGSPKNMADAQLFLLCSHYDTKTFDLVRFVGANDAGSSSGALIEIARVLARNPRIASKIEIVFFDGEEAYQDFSETDGLFGSRHFARQLIKEKRAKQFRGGIVLDMIGDRSLNITLSPDSPATLARDIFASAEALGVRNHFTYFDREITDDHTPLNAAGIPTIDLIDFDYPWWHTADDTLDKISAESLEIVSRVTLYYLSEYAFE